MKKSLLFIVLFLPFFLFALTNQDNEKLLSNAKRYILKNYSLKTPKYEFILKPSSLKVENKYAVLSATVTYEDGSSVSTDYIEDLFFVLCFEKKMVYGE